MSTWLKVGMRAAPADQYTGPADKGPVVLEVKWFPEDAAFRVRLSSVGMVRDDVWYHEDEIELL